MIPLLDLNAQHRALRRELDVAIGSVLDRAQFILGEDVRGFEESFAEYCDAGDAIAVSSGTAALHLALLALDVGPGDEVVTTPMTFVATVAAIRYAGATPVLADIDPLTLTLDPAAVEKALTPRTKVILPVHLHGQMADMSALRVLADRHGLALLEDAAQAHGATFGGRRAGSLGDLACFSFYPGKNLGACGEGGAVVTSDSSLAERIRLLRDWGQTEKYVHAVHGFNYRMDAIQGAVLSVKLRHLERWTESRRRLAALYDAKLADGPVATPFAAPDRRHVYHVYAVRSDDRDRLRKDLQGAGIATGMHYPTPVHLQPGYSDLGYSRGDFPIAERYAMQTLSLPLYAELTNQAVTTVVDRISTVCEPA